MKSVKSVLETSLLDGQMSLESGTPSLSQSPSQASPRPSSERENVPYNIM